MGFLSQNNINKIRIRKGEQNMTDYEKAQRLSNSKTLKQNVRSRRIVDEYQADGEWHYEYKID